MKKLWILWFLLFVRLLIAQTSIPAGWVYGTWEATGSPYLIEGDIFVMSESLNIEPGVVVEFQGHYGLDIGSIGITGQLIAMGTEQDSILFTCSNSSIGWKGLRFYDEQTWCDSSKIKYCKIEYGRATGTGDDSKGGAVFCQDYSKLDLSYSNIINNYTQHDNGGAIYLENSTPYLHHLIIQNNENGGIYSNDQSGVISYSEIINNTEYGISNFYEVSNCVIISNNDYYGIENTIDVLGSVISNCDHGLHYVNFVENCTIKENYYGIYNGGDDNDLEVISSKIVNNTYGMNLYESHTDVINSLIANNTSGMIMSDLWASNPCSFNIVNCTITNNMGVGVGIFCEAPPDPQRTNSYIYNSVFWNNGDDDVAAEIFGYYYNIAAHFSCFEDELEPDINVLSTCINNNPEFINPCAGIGTGYNALEADWSLNSNSLCINHGIPNTNALNLPEIDLAGNPRIYQGNTPIIDMGAYEFQAEPDQISEIEIGTTEIDFGAWMINNSSEVMTSHIYNIGFANLEISSIIAPQCFYIKLPSDPDFQSILTDITVEPDENVILQIMFIPETEDVYNDSIAIHSNDPDESVSYIYVTGEGTVINNSIYGNITEDVIIADDIDVIGDVTVANGVTLTILPGVNVNVTGYYSIDIMGRLLAVGTEQDSIYFSRQNYTWQGIKFINTPALNDSSKIVHCKISKSGGGAVEINNFNKIVISQSTLSNNSRGECGGGIYCRNSALEVVGIDFIHDSSSSNNGAGGGAIYCNNSDITLIDCRIIECSVHGGEDSGSDGGGILIWNSSCYLERCDIEGNSTSSDTEPCFGGGIWSYLSQLVINNSVIKNNNSNCGSGIYADESDMRIANTLICNNTSGYQYEGDGICCSGDVCVEIYNDIFYGNDGYGFDGSGDNIYISNCIFQENHYNQLRICGGYSGNGLTTADLSYNAIENGIDGLTINNPNWVICNWLEGNIDSDPLFISPENSNFHLFANSPCIDAGTPDVAGMNLPEFDLDGNPRIYNNVIDMGCYEWQGVENNNEEIPQGSFDISHLSNYPNPFNPSTTISFDLTAKDAKNAKIEIYNIKGQKVKTLPVSPSQSHTVSIVWNGTDDNGKDVSSGVYFYKLKAGNYEKSKKMLLLK